MFDNLVIIKKNVKNYNIKITNSQEIIVVAPIWSSAKDIEEVVLKRKKWIEKRLDFIKTSIVYYPKELKASQKIYYLGKAFEIKIFKDTKNSLDINNNYATFWLKDFDKLKVKEELLLKWYKKKAKEVFGQLISYYSKMLNLEVKKINIKKMRTRWGSCNNTKKYINLNIWLIVAPIDLIEYVVVHEISHLVYPNHSKDFYNYLGAILKDYKTREKSSFTKRR